MMSRGIFNEIMRIAEDCRETVTIILAGYGSDIEQKLFAYNIGMFLPDTRRTAANMRCHRSCF